MVKTQRVAKEIERRRLNISVADCSLYGLATFKLLRLIYKDELIKTSYVITNQREIVNTLGVDSNVFNLDSHLKITEEIVKKLQKKSNTDLAVVVYGSFPTATIGLMYKGRVFLERCGESSNMDTYREVVQNKLIDFIDKIINE